MATIRTATVAQALSTMSPLERALLGPLVAREMEASIINAIYGIWAPPKPPLTEDDKALHRAIGAVKRERGQ
jgi:hypothetical protein